MLKAEEEEEEKRRKRAKDNRTLEALEFMFDFCFFLMICLILYQI